MQISQNEKQKLLPKLSFKYNNCYFLSTVAVQFSRSWFWLGCHFTIFRFICDRHVYDLWAIFLSRESRGLGGCLELAEHCLENAFNIFKSSSRNEMQKRIFHFFFYFASCLFVWTIEKKIIWKNKCFKLRFSNRKKEFEGNFSLKGMKVCQSCVEVLWKRQRVFTSKSTVTCKIHIYFHRIFSLLLCGVFTVGLAIFSHFQNFIFTQFWFYSHITKRISDNLWNCRHLLSTSI